MVKELASLNFLAGMQEVFVYQACWTFLYRLQWKAPATQGRSLLRVRGLSGSASVRGYHACGAIKS